MSVSSCWDMKIPMSGFCGFLWRLFSPNWLTSQFTEVKWLGTVAAVHEFTILSLVCFCHKRSQNLDQHIRVHTHLLMRSVTLDRQANALQCISVLIPKYFIRVEYFVTTLEYFVTVEYSSLMVLVHGSATPVICSTEFALTTSGFSTLLWLRLAHLAHCGTEDPLNFYNCKLFQILGGFLCWAMSDMILKYKGLNLGKCMFWWPSVSRLWRVGILCRQLACLDIIALLSVT